ncbi:MAG: hypothetical protein Q9196_003643 [Gyalolechia fulgens]
MAMPQQATGRPPGPTATAPLNMAASNTGKLVRNMEHMILAIPKVTPAISELPSTRLLLGLTLHSSGSPAPPQDHRGYDPYPPQQPPYGQHQQEHQQQPYYDPNNPQHQQQGYPPHDPNAPYDPNAPEGERGLGGALVGGLAGRFAGKQMGGGHGFLGTIAGAIAGSKLQDKFKEKPHHGGHHGGRHGSSQWGGSGWGGK